GVKFRNDVDDLGDINPYNFIYVYNGGGVATGDINNDGLPDIFLTGNQVKSVLYLNLSAFKFKDITAAAGIDDGKGWTTGVCMVDINGDGFLDIYICKSGPEKTENRSNLLFINNGDLTFSEEGKAYNLGDAGSSTHANFFDFDNDGDLDVYILNHPEDFSKTSDIRFQMSADADSASSDKLMENVGSKFIDVTQSLGLDYTNSYGLSVCVSDVNNDGWLDIYVANDFFRPDYYYINQNGERFVEGNTTHFNKNALYSMGSDFSDVNNDGEMDLFVADMDPEGHFRRKNNDIILTMDFYKEQENIIQFKQFSRNMLQIQNPDGTFSELGEFAGVARTDWSWSSLFFDGDNDGWKDLLVTNGTKKDLHDIDYMNLKFGNSDLYKVKFRHDAQDLIENMPSIKMMNYAFKNKGGAQFDQVMEAWGLDQMINSQGAAYADLNNDGFLDLILNNADTVAFIYKNKGAEQPEPGNYLKIKLWGEQRNSSGLGSKIHLYAGGKYQMQELSNARGFQSSSEPLVHFGVGNADIIDSVRIEWLGGKHEVLYEVSTNQLLDVYQKSAILLTHPDQNKIETRTYFRKRQFPTNELFIHKESDFYDFKRDKLIPHQLSKEGPKIAVSDVNGDGRDDFLVGGAAGQSCRLYTQNKAGRFDLSKDQSFEEHEMYEDMGILFFDANGDGKPDLYITSGSNEFEANSPLLQDRLYMNTGNGKFIFQEDLLPKMITSSSVVIAADFDGDKDLDLFVGGRLIPGEYPRPPRSYLLRNDEGKYTDVTHELAPELEKIGMVTDALWTDIDGDEKVDLVIVGEWLPICIFKNSNGKFVNITEDAGLAGSNGWWYSIKQGDFDNDGDMDFIVGNFGLNSILKCSAEEPVSIYAADFDDNGSLDPIMFHYLMGKEATFVGRDLFCKQMPKYFNRFNTYRSFAESGINEIFTDKQLSSAMKLSAQIFASCYVENLGKGRFKITPLLIEAQTAPIYGITVLDFNKDDRLDVFLCGNSYSNFYEEGNLDAFRGLLL
ncbi:MAG TPA: RNA-binding protein, partial [Flavobacteriales bacterium]|nr:RNA-binding protein [Flavobacteriales bacterium]